MCMPYVSMYNAVCSGIALYAQFSTIMRVCTILYVCTCWFSPKICLTLLTFLISNLQYVGCDSRACFSVQPELLWFRYCCENVFQLHIHTYIVQYMQYIRTLQNVSEWIMMCISTYICVCLCIVCMYSMSV